MERAGLIDILREYGADVSVIDGRFNSDARLYRERLNVLLSGSDFGGLSPAIEKGEARRAFDLARSILKACEELGLTPLYESVCVLVEILRPRDGARGDVSALNSAREQLKTVLARRDELKALVSAAPEEPARRDEPAHKDYVKRVDKPYTSLNRMILAVLAGLLVTGFVGGVILNDVIRGYRRNVETESATHMIEIGDQIRLCVERSLECDWKAAYSVASGLTQADSPPSEADVRSFMAREREIWGVSDVILYNEAGFGVASSDAVVNNDRASDAAYYAKRDGEYMSVVRSQVSLIVPVETSAVINSSRIVAAGVVRDLSSFIDGMGISSFDGNASVYLTDENGVVMSRLSQNSRDTFNVTTLFGESRLTQIDGERVNPREILASEEPRAYKLATDKNDVYVVSAPVSTRRKELRLFYMAGEEYVNENMNSFSRKITHVCVAVIAAFAGLSVIAFTLVYTERKKQFSSVLYKRERTFDLLVKNSQTAFALFTPNNPSQQFISANAEKIIGGERLVIEKTARGFQMTGDDGRQTRVSEEINEKMRDWDGASEFHSGYLPRGGVQGGGYFEIMLYPLDGEANEYVGIAQDATRKHDREEAVREALDMARRSDEAKTRFLSNMSHDIRTPLNAIINMTHFAIDAVGQPDTQYEYLEIIRESSDHLLSLINDILDVSRIESGQSILGNAPFDLRGEVFRVRDMIKPLCEAKKQMFATDFSKAYTRGILGDRLKLGQILVNVLGNAVKFTPEGGEISFRVVELPSLGKNLATFRFIVTDNGVGISKEHLPHIFEAFMRAEDSRVSQQEGTGLGLSICQSFVMAMGGSIKCESELDKGSVFTIEITFERAERPEEPKKAATSGETRQFTGRKCLVFEDNRTNQIIARTILERCGFEVDMADDGKIGLQKFLSSKSNYYDIIYMDIRMPGMDGYEAADAIRRSGKSDAEDIPIVAMTANVFAEDVEKSRLAGMNGHLGKPIVVSQLIETTALALQERRRALK